MATWRMAGVHGLVGVALAALCHRLHVQLESRSARLPQLHDAREALPSPEALKIMSLGYATTAADYFWLRAVSHFGDRRMHKQLYPNLGPLLERVVALDPLFVGAYVFAGQALTFRGMDYSIPMTLLKQGVERCPDDWRIGFFLGFNAYYLMQDYALAAKTLSAVAAMPSAPPFLGPLATRLAAEAGTPQMGLALVDSMLAGTQDAKLRSIYLERRNLLLLELHLKTLQEAVQTFGMQHHHLPTSLQALVDAGLVAKIPADPLGGSYWLDSRGTVKTAHESQRLRLRPGAEQPPAHASH